MHTIIGSFGKDCVLKCISSYGSKAELFESNLFWMGQYNHPHKPHMWRRTNPILI